MWDALIQIFAINPTTGLVDLNWKIPVLSSVRVPARIALATPVHQQYSMMRSEIFPTCVPLIMLVSCHTEHYSRTAYYPSLMVCTCPNDELTDRDN